MVRSGHDVLLYHGMIICDAGEISISPCFHVLIKCDNELLRSALGAINVFGAVLSHRRRSSHAAFSSCQTAAQAFSHFRGSCSNNRSYSVFHILTPQTDRFRPQSKILQPFYRINTSVKWILVSSVIRRYCKVTCLHHPDHR
jgi:hypothetical protein